MSETEPDPHRPQDSSLPPQPGGSAPGGGPTPEPPPAGVPPPRVPPREPPFGAGTGASPTGDTTTPVAVQVGQGSLPPEQERNFAVLAHVLPIAGTMVGILGWLPPLVLWLLKKEESPYVDDQGKEALNFQITVTLALMLAGISVMCVVGIVLLPLVLIASWVFSILGAVAASRGEAYRYPWTLRLVS